MIDLSGVFPPAITFFKEDGAIDYEACKSHTDFLIAKGVDGLAFQGTSGEFSSMTMAEKKEHLERMAAHVAGRTKVLAGVGDTCIGNTLELLEHAAAVGADGALLINPYFNVYADNMVEAYYTHIAENSPLPVIIYNFPALTGYSFPVDMVRRLAEKYESIVGIKETVSDPVHLRDMLGIKKVRADFKVYIAFEIQALGALNSGADGFINSSANFAPELTVNLLRTFKSGDLRQAGMWYEKLCDAMEMYSYSQPLLVACKQATYTRVMGRDYPERLPTLPMDKAGKERVSSLLDRLGLD